MLQFRDAQMMFKKCDRIVYLLLSVQKTINFNNGVFKTNSGYIKFMANILMKAIPTFYFLFHLQPIFLFL